MASSRARWLLVVLALAAGSSGSSGSSDPARAQTDTPAREPLSTTSRELGLRLGASGQFERAYSLLKPWAAAHPEDVEAVTAAAFCALRLERFDEAETLLRAVPISLPSGRLLHGRLLLERARLEEVVEILTPALETAPETLAIDLRKVLARALLALGRPAEAVELLERYGVGARTALLLSRALFENGSPEKAQSVLAPLAQQVLAASSQSTPADSGLVAAVGAQYGQVLHTLGDSEAALPFLQLAVRLDSESRIAWHALGLALAAVGRRQDALDALAEARRLLKPE